jgi:hypothetical protein
MRKSEQVSVIKEAFNELWHLDLQDGYYDVVDRLLDMNVEAERRHRRGEHNTGLPVKDAARLFVVKHMLDGFAEPDRFTVDDILAIRNEVLYAQAYAKRHHDKLTAWASKWASQFKQVDYAFLMRGAA